MTKLVLIVFIIGSACLGTKLFVPADSTPMTSDSHTTITAPQDNQDQDEVEKTKKQLRQQFMRGKLDSNKKIVEGLVTSDFKLIAAGANEVGGYVIGQHWFVLDTAEYKNYSQNMEAISRKLAKAAKERNIEAAALRYMELTVNCIDCHQYIATTKY